MKPLLSTLPPERRTVLFAPVAMGALFLIFLILAIATDHFLATLLIAPPLGVGVAYALLGWPRLLLPDGRPLVSPVLKPWLFFGLAPLFTAALYPLLGVLLTQVPIPPGALAWGSLALAITGGISLAYMLVGFPNLARYLRDAWNMLPPERRPFLFFPLSVLIFLMLYLGLGAGSTVLLGELGGAPSLLNLQILILLPLTAVMAGAAAYFLVGFPKPTKHPLTYIPQVPAQRRPIAFLVTVAVLTLPFTVGIGVLLALVPTLPEGLVLPLGLVLGVIASLGVAALSWGTPTRWRTLEGYKPGLPAHTKIPLLVTATLGTAVIVTVLSGLAGLEMFWGVLLGAALGALVGLHASGATKHIAARRHASTWMPEIPDGVKPLVLFPVWFLVAALLFTILTFILPSFVMINAVAAGLIGLLLATLLVEQGLLQEILTEQRRERAVRRELAARRKAALQAAKNAPHAETEDTPRTG